VVAASPATARTDSTLTMSPKQLATAAYTRMTPDQRLGQLFMAGVPSTGVSQGQLAQLAAHDVDDVILVNSSTSSRSAVHGLAEKLVTHLRDAGVAPFISTDQEGGEVQRLTGRGFSPMPSALAQGKLSVSRLRAASGTWGRQLREAGVDLDLAPVADTVPAKHATTNQPIGQFDREFGHTPAVVAPHVVAFIRGMHDADVATTIKHFPGLGRASGNTDTSRHVTDPTTRHDPYLKPFRSGVIAGTQFAMVSSATYPQIDPQHPACFSATVITTMLRGDLQFGGVVISDDLGTTAMAHIAKRTRAIEFFSAGGTMLLDTSPGDLVAMIRGVRNRVAASPRFAATIQDAVMNVLLAKANAGLIKP
jgi:beta-N-acetylhexosaminidase